MPQPRRGKPASSEPILPDPEAEVSMPRIVGKEIHIPFRDSIYDIPLEKCGSYEKIIWWTMHLAEKSWTTKEVLERFIMLACSHHGLPDRGNTSK